VGGGGGGGGGRAGAGADRMREESCASAAVQAAAERARILHQARLEAIQIVGDAREALVDEALRRTREHLAHLRENGSYATVLRQLVTEALAELDSSGAGASTIGLVGDPRDVALLRDILFDIGLGSSATYELGCWGGVVARSDDRRVIAINTLEARLDRATPHLRRHLAALFENGAA
jgi:vacuolar-type H+-ATPase subunit E/Vma4